MIALALGAAVFGEVVFLAAGKVFRAEVAEAALGAAAGGATGLWANKAAAQTQVISKERMGERMVIFSV